MFDYKLLLMCVLLSNAAEILQMTEEMTFDIIQSVVHCGKEMTVCACVLVQCETKYIPINIFRVNGIEKMNNSYPIFRNSRNLLGLMVRNIK